MYPTLYDLEEALHAVEIIERMLQVRRVRDEIRDLVRVEGMERIMVETELQAERDEIDKTLTIEQERIRVSGGESVSSAWDRVKAEVFRTWLQSDEPEL